MDHRSLGKHQQVLVWLASISDLSQNTFVRPSTYRVHFRLQGWDACLHKLLRIRSHAPIQIFQVLFVLLSSLAFTTFFYFLAIWNRDSRCNDFAAIRPANIKQPWSEVCTLTSVCSLDPINRNHTDAHCGQLFVCTYVQKCVYVCGSLWKLHLVYLCKTVC